MDDVQKQRLDQALKKVGLDALAADKPNDFKNVFEDAADYLPFVQDWVETELKRRDHTAELKRGGLKQLRNYVLTEYWNALRDHPHGMYYFRDFAREIFLDEEDVANALEYFDHEGILESIAIGSWSFSHSGRKLMEEYDDRMAEEAEAKKNPGPNAKESDSLRDVFVGHGRSDEYHKVITFLSSKFDVKGKSFEHYKVAGGQVIPTLEKLLQSCSVAIIVATAEDDSASGVRPRQNVVHEIGLFQGRYGFEKVAVLMERGTEDFSNIAGLVVIPFERGKIDLAFMELTDFMRKAGYPLA